MPNKEVAMKAKSFLYIYTHAIEGEKEKAATDRKTTLSISSQSVFFFFAYYMTDNNLYRNK